MLNRRDVLKIAAATGASGALGPLGGCKEPSPKAQATPVTPSAQRPELMAQPDPNVGVRRAMDRGIVDRGWLKARHTFSFSRYRDPEWDSFRFLRVINEDTIQPDGGFPTHPHRDMEIITYILEGALEHRDTLGNQGTIRPGEVQYMSAGAGIRHSEFNRGEVETHLLQIWLLPKARGGEPRYGSRHFGDERHGELRLIASPSGRDGSLSIRQETDLYAAVLKSGQEVLHPVADRRNVWLQVARGSLVVNGHAIGQGDGVWSRSTLGLKIRADSDAEILLFDMG